MPTCGAGRGARGSRRGQLAGDSAADRRDGRGRPLFVAEAVGETLTRARMAWVGERADQVYYFTKPGNRVSLELHERLGFVQLPGRWVPPGSQPGDAGTQRFYRASVRG